MTRASKRPPSIARCIALAGCVACCAALAATPGLTGRVWAWQGMHWDDGRIERAVDPGHYTVLFEADGSVRVRADCNAGGGRYARSGEGGIELSPIATTKKGCPPPSQGQEFVRALAQASRYAIEGDRLVLRLPSGAMHFTTAAR